MEIDFKEIALYVVIFIIVLLAAQHLDVVVSGSMEPAFYRGDIVLVEKADFQTLHINPLIHDFYRVGNKISQKSIKNTVI